MAGKISIAIIATVMGAFLAACAKEPPKCSDEGTFSLVRQILLDQIGGGEGLSTTEIQENLKIEYSRASAFEEKIKKYSCEAKLNAGGTYQLPITFQSQLDDKDQHIVSINGISQVDLLNVKSALTENIKKNRAEKDNTTKPVEVPPTKTSKPTPNAQDLNFIEPSEIKPPLKLVLG